MSRPWPKVRLGELLRQRKPDIAVDPTSTYGFAGVYCFGRGVFRGRERSGSEFAYDTLTRLRAGEFVYPKLMAWEGAFGIVPRDCDGCYVSPEFPVFEIDTTRLAPTFLGFYFRIPAVWEAISGGSTGTNVRRRRLNPADLLQQAIPLPSMEEQARVVTWIEELAVQAHEIDKVRQEVAAEIQATVVAMAHRLDLSEATKKSSGWQKALLGQCITVVDDSHRVLADQAYPNFGIYSFGRGLFPKAPIQGVHTSAGTLRRVRAGQFIYSRLFAFEGAYGMVPDEYDGFYVSNEYPTFECDPAVLRVEFLASYFSSPSVWNQVAVGSKGLGDRRQRVQPDQILGHSVWVPPLAWQSTLAKVYGHLAEIKRQQEEMSTEVEALLPTVVDRAFRGGR